VPAKSSTVRAPVRAFLTTASYASQDKIGPDSAGCQVFRWVDDFNSMMSLARQSRDRYGNSFTYTLIDQREQLQNQRKKEVNYTIIGGVLIGLTAYAYFLYKKGIILKK
jgi:NAD(P)H-nitrite reductase large subunit